MMKKAIFLLAAAALCTGNVFAQKTKHQKTPKFFVRAGAGYAFAHAASDYTYQNSLTSESVKKYSYGAGFNATLALGYQFLPNVAFELGGYYGFAPKKYTGRDVYTNAINTNQMQAKNPFYLIPAIVICTNTEPFDVYTRLGVVLPLAGKTQIDFSRQEAVNLYEERYSISSRFGVGFQGALGVKYTITKRFKVWIEATGISMSRWEKSGEITSYKVNHVETVSSFTTQEKKTNYVFDYQSGTSGNSSVPAEAPTVAIPYSTVGLGLGVSIGL